MDALGLVVAGREAEWRRRAACRDQPTELFFPHRGEEAMRRLALAICRRCPVREECLATHRREPFGIFGGVPARRRRRAEVA